MTTDLWHYPRAALAEQVMELFEIGLSSALTFFAPRRMGKTEFLRKDIMPYAKAQGWAVYYFSFLDADTNSQEKFQQGLLQFACDVGVIKGGPFSKSRIKKLTGSVIGFSAELEVGDEGRGFIQDVGELIASLAKKQRIILLLDEVQALASSAINDSFLATLRTALDMNKDRVKAIFTGSSRDKLMNMFSDASAPFFHFGQNLDFPCLEKCFTDHLANAYQEVTTRKLDKDQLWLAFQAMDQVPQLIRSLVERLALNPAFSIDQAKESVLRDLYHDRSYADIWNHLSGLERLLLSYIAQGGGALYSEEVLQDFAQALGVDALNPSTVQSALRSLSRKEIIIKSLLKKRYVIDDPNLNSWIKNSGS